MLIRARLKVFHNHCLIPSDHGETPITHLTLVRAPIVRVGSPPANKSTKAILK
jgi:hypothetical protein